MSFSSPRAFLTVLSGARRGARVPIPERCIVGTDDSCDFIIDDEPAPHNERAVLDLSPTSGSGGDDAEAGPTPASPARIRRERDHALLSEAADDRATARAPKPVHAWEAIEFDIPFAVGDTLLMLSAPDLDATAACGGAAAGSDSAMSALLALDAEASATSLDWTDQGAAVAPAITSASHAASPTPSASSTAAATRDENLTAATGQSPVSGAVRRRRPRYIAAWVCLVLAVGALLSVSMKNFAKGVGAPKPGQQTAGLSAPSHHADAATVHAQATLERAGLSGLAEVKYLDARPVVVAFADSPADLSRLRQRFAALAPDVAYRLEMSAQLLTKVRAELTRRNEQMTARSSGHGRIHLSGVVRSSAHAQALVDILSKRFPTAAAFEFTLADTHEASLAVASLAAQAGISTFPAKGNADGRLSIDVDGGIASVTRLTELLAAHGAHAGTLLPVTVSPRLGGSGLDPGLRPKLIVMGLAPYAVLEDGRRVVVGQQLGRQTVGRISRDRLRLDNADS
ncbi:MAG: hypothetical protein ACRYG5_15840 [Janthinobacterium lividum]